MSERVGSSLNSTSFLCSGGRKGSRGRPGRRPEGTLPPRNKQRERERRKNPNGGGKPGGKEKKKERK